MTGRLIRTALSGFLLMHAMVLRAQPEDWFVVPSAFEFSMTVTYTISVNGLVGAGQQNVAAVFDGDGNCRGLGTTDFLASNGYYTGLMLVYGNQTTEPGLEVRIWDANLDSLPGCDDTVDFIANGISGSLSSPIVFYGIYDPLVGCTDPAACNYLSSAITDDGSCLFPGCDDPLACNYLESSPCYDNSSCTFPEQFLDCTGDCLSDFDGDGICDELEIGGCTDDRACNFNPAATDEDCSCEFPFYPLDCNGNCYLDTDGDGICEADEIPGCDDPVGCNFDSEATDNDGSCVYCCYSQYDTTGGFALSIERHAGLGTDVTGLDGLSTFRVYLTCPSPLDRVLSVSGSGGNSTFIGSSSNFYQSPSGSLLLSEIDSTTFADNPEITFDSWLTIGHEIPTSSSTLTASTGIWSTLFELGEDLFIGGASGDGWSIDPSDDAGLAGDDLKVLLGQFTSSTSIEGSLNIMVLPSESSESIVVTPLFVAPPCGCTDPAACNFDPSNTYDDGTCILPPLGVDCSGQCESDADGDGVCDGDEVSGCMDFNASNYNSIATDNEGCLYPGCTYPDAVNYALDANQDDGSCTFVLESSCPTDINGDGITAASDILALLATYGDPCE